MATTRVQININPETFEISVAQPGRGEWSARPLTEPHGYTLQELIGFGGEESVHVHLMYMMYVGGGTLDAVAVHSRVNSEIDVLRAQRTRSSLEGIERMIEELIDGPRDKEAT